MTVGVTDGWFLGDRGIGLDRWLMRMLVKFEIYNDGERWCARGIGVDIFTQGNTMDELVKNLREAVEVHFEDQLQTGEEIKILSISEIEVRPLVEATSG
jgi:hypothetical protein